MLTADSVLRHAAGRTTRRRQERLPVIEFKPSLVDYVRLLTSLIERRWVGREEVVAMLRRTLRQRSFARETRIDYALRFLKEAPP